MDVFALGIYITTIGVVGVNKVNEDYEQKLNDEPCCMYLMV